MIPLTVLMLTMLLCLAPLKFVAKFRLDLSQKRLFVEVWVFFVRVFKEEFQLQGRNLVCSGTVNTQIDVFQTDGKAGVNLLKALVWDSVNVKFAVDFCKYSPFAMLCVETICGATTAVACAFSHCKVHTSTCFSQVNCVFGNVVVSVSLAEILWVLIKESARKRKTE
ncbi:MAG: hypothetical protein ACI4QH_03895 [Candidatus Fimimonas sp.]